MRHIYLIFLFITTAVLGQGDLDTVANRIFEKQVERSVNDDDITEMITPQNLSPAGFWYDLNYNDHGKTNWDPNDHLKRENKLTRAYNKPSSIHYHSPALYDKLLQIFEYFTINFNNGNIYSDNWWYNDIGVGEKRGLSLIMMKPHFPSQTILDGAESPLLKYNFGDNNTGTNKVWFCKVSLFKAIAQDSTDHAATAFEGLASEIKITSEEGIQTDYVFNQHGQLLYNGGYGKSFVEDQVELFSFSAGTIYEYPEDKVAILSDLMIKGDNWMGHRNFRDFSILGRYISREEAIQRSSNDYEIMAAANTPLQSQFEEIVDYMNDESDFPEPGTKHFWTGDIMTQHGPSYYLSARIPSNRILAAESINSENLKGNYFAFGGTNILVNGDEYLEIMPVWDWSRTPGITFENTGNFPDFKKTNMSSKPYSGGVANGISGFAAYDFEFDGVEAKKIYFMPGDVMFCMGTGINATKPQPVLTNMNQCWSRGDVYINRGNMELFTNSSENFDDLKWVHHDNVGYYFPEYSNITLENQNQWGSWYSINNSESNDVISGEVFSLWTSHGNSPNNANYQYLVVPDQDLIEFQETITENPISVISNTEEIQAVKYIPDEIYGIAFYSPGTIDLGTSFSVTVDKQCLVLIDKTGAEYKISVSNPLNTEIDVDFSISKNLIGPNGTVFEGESILFNLPGGDEAGATLTYDFTDAFGDAEMILEAEDAVVYSGIEKNVFPGYTGTGYIDYQNEVGSYIDFKVNMDIPCRKLLRLRYANDSQNNRAMEIMVNREVINSSLSFNPTESLSDWRYQTIEAELMASENVIRVTSVTDDGGPNLDHLAIFPVVEIKENDPLSLQDKQVNDVDSVKDEVGNDSILADSIVFDNLVSRQLRISNLPDEIQSISIVDGQGRVLHHRKLHLENSVVINVMMLKKGMYFIQFEDGQNKVVKKFVKE